MITIREAVESTLANDYVAMESLKRRVMNFSEYARSIKPHIEAISKKEVGLQSIVVTLARLEKKYAEGAYRPLKVSIAQLTVQSPITHLVYRKTSEVTSALTAAAENFEGQEDVFFAFSSSTKDIALTVSEKIASETVKLFPISPIVHKNGLSALSIRFDEKLVREPNVGILLLQKLAARNVVLDAAFTTHNEFTLVFENRYLHDSIEALQSGAG
jgi:hypothetical protein